MYIYIHIQSYTYIYLTLYIYTDIDHMVLSNLIRKAGAVLRPATSGGDDPAAPILGSRAPRLDRASQGVTMCPN